MATRCKPALSGEFLAGMPATALMIFFACCCAGSLAGTGWLIFKFGLSLTAVFVCAGWCAAAVALLWCVERRFWMGAVLIFVGLRVGMFLITQGAITATPDPHFYDIVAKHIARGEDFTDVVSGVQLRAHAPRLYSILLGGMYLLTGGSVLAPFVLNAAIDALTAFMIFMTSRQFGASVKAAASMGALYAIWPYVVVASAFAQKEGLGSLLVLACIWTLARSWKDESNRGAQYGLFLGLIGLTQPAWFPMAAAFPLLLVMRQPVGCAAKFLAVAAVTSVLVLLPWIVRNWILTGGFIPLTSSFGMNLYVNAARVLVFPAHLSHLPEPDWNREMVKAGFAIIAADPWKYATHEIKMIVTAFTVEHGQYFNLAGIKSLRIAPANFLLVMQVPLIALWGAAHFTVRKRKGDVLMIGTLLLVLLYIASVGIWFEFGQRHRAYLLPLLLSWAAVALSSRFERPQTRRAIAG